MQTADLKNSITIIMPIFNGGSTLDEVLGSLEHQFDKYFIHELIFINDNSTDDSEEIIKKYQKISSYKTRLINNTVNEGLAKNYNQGLELCFSTYFILMHQDILLSDNESFKKILKPFFEDDNVIAVFPGLLHPFDVWNEYNFWQKCLSSRFVGKTVKNLTGKFDCYDKKKLLEHVGRFNSLNFRTAGEDGDIKRRITKMGFKIGEADFDVIHLHNKEKDFNYKKILKKEAQLAEAQGTLLRLHGVGNEMNFLKSFFREILFISLFIPMVNILAILAVASYIFSYTYLVYVREYKDFRIIFLPFINLLILPVATFYSFKGYILKKQSL